MAGGGVEKEKQVEGNDGSSVSRTSANIRATLSREADAANWEPGLPQRSYEEGQWTSAWSKAAEVAKVAGPPPACLCKFRGAICIGKT